MKKLLILAIILSGCTVNKHGIFIGQESQKEFNNTVRLQYQAPAYETKKQFDN